MSSLVNAESAQAALHSLYRPNTGRKQVPIALHSRRLGYKSPRLLEMILKGDRRPSLDFLARTADLFSLSDMERSLLELMVQKETLQARGRSVDGLERRIQNLKRKAVSVEFLEPQFCMLVSDWYCLVVKQLLQSAPKGLSIAELTKKLRGKATEVEIEKAVHVLLHLGYVERDPAANAFVSVRKDSIYSRPDVPSQSVRNHHRQMMERATEALSEQDISEREMIALTFSCPPSAVPRLKEALRRFRDEIDAEFAQPASSVYQLNLQLFFHTK